MCQHPVRTAAVLALAAWALDASRLEARPDDGPALVQAAESEAASVPVGFYTGSCSNPSLSTEAIPFQAEVARIAGRNLARLVCSQPGDACYEDWIWDDTSLLVTRHTFYPGTRRPDGRHEEVTQLHGYMTGGRYRVFCQDPSGMDCGLGLPTGSYLTITTTAGGFRCEVWEPMATDSLGKMALSRTFDFDQMQ